VKKNSLNGRLNVKVGSSRQGKRYRRRRRKRSDQQLGEDTTQATSGDRYGTNNVYHTYYSPNGHSNSTSNVTPSFPKSQPRHSKGSRETGFSHCPTSDHHIRAYALDKLQTDLHKALDNRWAPKTCGGALRRLQQVLPLGFEETRYGDRHRRKTNEASTNRIVGGSEWTNKSKRESFVERNDLLMIRGRLQPRGTPGDWRCYF